MQVNPAVYHLLRPLAYLCIKHGAKYVYDYVVPLVMTALFSCAYFLLPIKPVMLGEYGVVLRINGLLQVLVGFYIAALAAIATFNNPDMDSVMEGKPPRLRIRGCVSYEALTRRRFLSFLFGYLAFSSLVICIMNIFAGYISANVLAIPWAYVVSVVKITMIHIYVFIISQLFTVTLLGLYYLCDRAHIK